MSEKILIIEDNEQDQKIIRRYFLKAGFTDLHFVDNGEEGIMLAESLQPTVVVTDTRLPGIDGFEVCRQIKQGEKMGMPVIIMTGQIDAVDALQAKDAGAAEYCVKTADCGELIAAVKKVCQLPSKELETKWDIEKTNMAIKALYKELEKKNEELRELDRLKSKFVSTVSHELKTPLTIIKTALSQMLDGLYGNLKEEQRKKLTMALNSANSLRRIIDNLLDIAKLEAKKVELQIATFNFVQLAKEIKDSLEGLAQEKGISMSIRSSRPKIEIEADRDRIAQVLINLLGNAIKFTKEGSIEITIEDRLEFIECSVSDTGRGIAAEDLPKVFERFQQFGKSFAPGYEGTGLGLSICKEIIELHQGHIEVFSELNKGTTFCFTLPRHQQQGRSEG